MKANNVWQRDAINGVRKIPDGHKLKDTYKTWDEVSKMVDSLNAMYIKKDSPTFNASGVAGNYCIIMYGAKLIPDNAYIHMT